MGIPASGSRRGAEGGEARVWRFSLGGILAAQLTVYASELTAGFYDGRLHVNWGPPFWLLKAEAMHKVAFWTAGYAGVVSKAVLTPSGWQPQGWYASHPQFIAIPLYLWTGLFGFAEWSARSLMISLTLITTALLWAAVRERHGERRAAMFTAAWAALPVIVIYGRSLELMPFLMSFLALAALAHEKVLAGKRGWLGAWFAAMAGMLWSEWFGFVFVALFVAAQACVAWGHRPSRPLLRATLLGALAGCAIVGIQAALIGAGHERPLDQPLGGAAAAAGGSPTLAATLRYFWGLYYNASGRAAGAPLGDWFRKQGLFWATNFTAILGWLGLSCGLVSLARDACAGRRSRWRDGGMSLRDLFFLSALGTLLYALVVREASFVHLFYQYYYSVFVAWGLVELIEWGRAAAAPRPWAGHAALAAWALCIGVLLRGGISIMSIKGWGGPVEVKLLKSIRRYPPEATVGLIGSLDDNLLAYPNTEYYSGRRILSMYPEDGVKKDLVLLPPGDYDRQGAALDYLAAPKHRFELRACAPALCLWEKVGKTGS